LDIVDHNVHDICLQHKKMTVILSLTKIFAGYASDDVEDIFVSVTDVGNTVGPILSANKVGKCEQRISQ